MGAINNWGGMMLKNMSDILEKSAVAIMEDATHEEVVEKLLDLLKGSENITNHDKFRELIWEREKIISTGIGVGLAIPHARRNIIKNFVSSAVLIKNGCDWNSIDSVPVTFAMLIASPQDTHKEYLRILAQSVLLWKDEDKRTQILNSKSTDDLIAAISTIEFNI